MASGTRIFLLCILVLLFVACEPGVDIIAKSEGASTVLNIKGKGQGLNQISKLYFWDAASGKHIWILSSLEWRGDVRTDEVTFGVAPSEKGLEQVYPRGEESPKSPGAGDIIGIEVQYQYDDSLYGIPSVGAEYHFFEIQKDGAWKRISWNREDWTWKKTPDDPAIRLRPRPEFGPHVTDDAEGDATQGPQL